MMKQRENTTVTIVQETASAILRSLRDQNRSIANLEQYVQAEMDKIENRHTPILTRYREDRDATEKQLITLMKQNKPILFDGTDVVNLPHGSLIHNIADKVSIPKTALAECKAQGFQDVIKIAESLDRDKIEKWPDAKLILIGAERKQKEEFSYDLKK